jgi:hypothetical protein
VLLFHRPFVSALNAPLTVAMIGTKLLKGNKWICCCKCKRALCNQQYTRGAILSIFEGFIWRRVAPAPSAGPIKGHQLEKRRFSACSVLLRSAGSRCSQRKICSPRTTSSVFRLGGIIGPDGCPDRFGPVIDGSHADPAYVRAISPPINKTASVAISGVV